MARASAHLDSMQSLAWSPDGKWIATGAFRRVVLWNGETLAQEREITGSLGDRIAALRFLPDGKQLLAADGRVWVANGQSLHRFTSEPHARFPGLTPPTTRSTPTPRSVMA